MTKFNAKQFVKYLENMGFFVRNTTVMDGVDDHTVLADSFTATIDTENGLFEMTVTDHTILASKPNGTQRYWDNLTDARARSYVRQVLDFNAPVAKAEPEAAEAPQADVEGLTYVGTTANGEDLFEEVEPEAPEPETDPRDLPGRRAEGESFVHPVNGATYVMNELGQCFYKGLPISREEYSRAKAQAEASLQQARADAGPDAEAVIDRAWEALEDIDPYCEWGDQRAAEVVEALRGADPALADELAGALDAGGPEFAELTPDQMRYLEVAGSVTHGTVPEQVARVADELGLRGLSREGIVAVRNSAVRHLGDLMSEARDGGDWEALDRLIANMGGVCEAIDRILSGMGDAA